MGWKGYAVFIESMTVKEVLATFPGTFTLNDYTFKAEEAFAGSRADRLKKGTKNRLADFIIAQQGAWTVLFDPHWFTLDWNEHNVLTEFSKGRRIFSMLMESVSGSYFFWYYRDGVLRRTVQRIEGSISFEEGLPLPEEENIVLSWWEEEYLFLMLKRLTDWTWEKLQTVTYAGVDIDRKWYGMYAIHPDERDFVRAVLSSSNALLYPLWESPCNLSQGEEGYLEQIVLGDIGLDTLPSQISLLKHLKSVWLTNMKPCPELWTMSGLEALSLPACGLTTLPPEIGNLTNLRWLQLNDNNLLAELPSEISKLDRLEGLNLANTALTSLPPEIAQLTSLQELNVRGTRLVL